MKVVKDILKNLKAMGIEVDAKLIMGALALVVLVGGLVLAFIKKRREKAAVAQDAWADEEVARVETKRIQNIPASAFTSDWKFFKKNLPGVLRRAMYQFHPVIVFGETGSGKSSLIDTFIDWRRQARQYPGAQSEGSYLNFYLGTRSIAFEFPAELLTLPTQLIRKAMVRLFGPLLHSHEPVVIICLSVKTLREQSVDSIRELAESLRSKIDVISDIRKGPVTVQIALTHLDLIDGASAWSQLSEKCRVPSQLSLNKTDSHELADEIDKLRRLIPLALTTQSAETFMEFVSFSEQAPVLLEPLEDFLKTFLADSAMSSKPNVEKIFLTSQDKALPGSNPMVIPATESLPYLTLRKHRTTAIAMAAALLAAMAFVYSFQRSEWVAARDAVSDYKPYDHRELENQNRQTIMDFTDSDTRRLASSFNMGFYDRARQTLRGDFLDKLRTDVLLPTLDKSGESDHPLGHSLFTLALIYSSSSNDIGRLILQNKDDWEDVTGIPATIVESYVLRSKSVYPEQISVTLPKKVTRSAVYEREHWKNFIRKSQQVMAKVPISAQELLILQEEAVKLTEELKVIKSQRKAASVLELLHRDISSHATDSLKVYDDFFHTTRDLNTMADTLDKLLSTILATSLHVNHQDIVLLKDLCAELQAAIDNYTPREETLTFAFEESGIRTMTVSVAAWDQAVHRTRLRTMVNTFLHREHSGSHPVFLTGDTKFPNISLTPYNKPSAEFPGDALIPGDYSSAAFESEVLPSVTLVQSLLTELKFAPQLRASLDNFVARQVQDYATELRHHLDTFYGSFRIHARSPQALVIVLTQMLDQLGPFYDFLQAVQQTSVVALGEQNSHLLAPMAAVNQAYAPLQTILATSEKSDGLMPYKAILSQLKTDLQGNAESEEQEQDAPAPEEKGTVQQKLDTLLSPTGKLALSALNGADGNYIELIDGWVDSNGLNAQLAKPFKQPILAAYAIGLREIESVVSDLWAQEMAIPMEQLLSRFPFNPKASEDVSTDELTAFFHPTHGEFTQRFRQFLEPILYQFGGTYYPQRSPLGSPQVSDEMMKTINQVAQMSRTLWNDKGEPVPLALEITPHLFEFTQAAGKTLTLVYLSSGQTSLFNFNQKPSAHIVKVDWTKPSTAQVGVQLTDPQTGAHDYPHPMIVSESHWSLYRLLTQGKREGLEWSWNFTSGKPGETLVVPVTFKLQQDPWALFSIDSASTVSQL